ncbi:MAG: choice-of-anchor E domain-containing protein [Planctomycetota bacterium]|nr:MAG: choice-of-anchor E domain-containing protein [Planctomycetota bacterium]
MRHATTPATRRPQTGRTPRSPETGFAPTTPFSRFVSRSREREKDRAWSPAVWDEFHLAPTRCGHYAEVGTRPTAPTARLGARHRRQAVRATRHKSLRLLLPLVAVGICAVRCPLARGTTITQGPITANEAQSRYPGVTFQSTIAPFDTKLGKLTSVTLSLSSSMQGSLFVQNNDPSAAVTVLAGSAIASQLVLALKSDLSHPLLTDEVTALLPSNVTVAANQWVNQNLAGTHTTAVSLTQPADLAVFLGTNPLTFASFGSSYVKTLNTSPGVAANVTTGSTSHVTSNLSITYTYAASASTTLPEPAAASVVLSSMAIVGFALARQRRGIRLRGSAQR